MIKRNKMNFRKFNLFIPPLAAASNLPAAALRVGKTWAGPTLPAGYSHWI